ncbi:MAG: hypothetical protein Q9160_008656 [Pyrenula sp. 1 TL-2023]
MSPARGTSASAATTCCKTVLAGTIARGLLSEISDGLQTLHYPPHLLGVLANPDPAAKLYADWTDKTYDVEERLLTANNDPSVHGVIVYYPIFSNRQDQYLQQIVSISKDVEGLSHQYIFNMYQNIRFLDPDTQLQKSILPCTPLAVIKILEYLRVYNTILPYGNRLHGHTICVVNRSEVVGRPLAALLANDGAVVYSVDVTGVQKFTRGEGIQKRKHEVEEKEGWSLEDCAPLCDVVVTGVPGENFKFPCRLLREGAVCVNFSTEKNFGPEVKEKASIYVPAIGKVTIVVLLRNLLRIVQNAKASIHQTVNESDKNIESTIGMATPP